MNYTTLFIQLLPEAMLVIAALLLLGIAVTSESKLGRPLSSDSAASIAVAGMLFSALGIFFAKSSGPAATGMMTVDSLARMSKSLLLGFGALAALVGPARREIAQSGEYFAMMLFALVGLMLATGTNHLLFLFVSLELASLSLYLLAGFSRTKKAAEASLKYFLFGGVSAAFLLFGLSLLYGFAQSLDLSVIAGKLSANPTSGLAVAGLAMVLVGLGFKLAAAPFHYWAPDVYEGAPATSVALISAASKVAGLVVLIRVLGLGFSAMAGSASWETLSAGWAPWLAAMAAVSIVLGNVMAIVQKSVRRLLAYSAVANTGYLLVAICANGKEAAAAALFYVVIYGLATLGALAVTALVEREQGNDSPGAFAGLIQRSPFQAIAMLVFMASLAGIPPLAGFAGKFALFSTAMAAGGKSIAGLAWLVGLAAIMSAVSLYYYLSVLKQAFVVPGTDKKPAAPVSPAHALAVGVPAVALVLLGLIPSLLLEPITAAVLDVLGR